MNDADTASRLALGDAIWQRHAGTPLISGAREEHRDGLGATVFGRHSDFAESMIGRRGAGRGMNSGRGSGPFVIARRSVDDAAPASDGHVSDGAVASGSHGSGAQTAQTARQRKAETGQTASASRDVAALPLHAMQADEQRSVAALPLHATQADEQRSVAASPLQATQADEHRSVAAAPLHATQANEHRSVEASPLHAMQANEHRSVAAAPLHARQADEHRSPHDGTARSASQGAAHGVSGQAPAVSATPLVVGASPTRSRGDAVMRAPMPSHADVLRANPSAASERHSPMSAPTHTQSAPVPRPRETTAALPALAPVARALNAVHRQRDAVVARDPVRRAASTADEVRGFVSPAAMVPAVTPAVFSNPDHMSRERAAVSRPIATDTVQASASDEATPAIGASRPADAPLAASMPAISAAQSLAPARSVEASTGIAAAGNDAQNAPTPDQARVADARTPVRATAGLQERLRVALSQVRVSRFPEPTAPARAIDATASSDDRTHGSASAEASGRMPVSETGRSAASTSSPTVGTVAPVAARDVVRQPLSMVPSSVAISADRPRAQFRDSLPSMRTDGIASASASGPIARSADAPRIDAIGDAVSASLLPSSTTSPPLPGPLMARRPLAAAMRSIASGATVAVPQGARPSVPTMQSAPVPTATVRDTSTSASGFTKPLVASRARSTAARPDAPRLPGFGEPHDAPHEPAPTPQRDVARMTEQVHETPWDASPPAMPTLLHAAGDTVIARQSADHAVPPRTTTPGTAASPDAARTSSELPVVTQGTDDITRMTPSRATTRGRSVIQPAADHTVAQRFAMNHPTTSNQAADRAVAHPRMLQTSSVAGADLDDKPSRSFVRKTVSQPAPGASSFATTSTARSIGTSPWQSTQSGAADIPATPLRHSPQADTHSVPARGMSRAPAVLPLQRAVQPAHATSTAPAAPASTDTVAESYGVVPLSLQAEPNSAEAPPKPANGNAAASPDAKNADATAPGAAELADQAWQIIMDRLAIERERRGGAPWP
ncbi:hypothetical protein AWB78_02109 [Caballeronia calidae]|uniref:Uncharacterized protein n=1 Tax=Caballeronia calidae TaxID=1777139 RepID=A0A158AYL1_9BURK|nr:hypothetical protein [Caballeronia calidae]SAK63048.1 hypothetical protein AWB78_02109 [Caballeronia calidae]